MLDTSPIEEDLRADEEGSDGEGYTEVPQLPPERWQLPPPPVPEWIPNGVPGAIVEEWRGGGSGETALLSMVNRGTHVNCKYDFYLINKDAAIPMHKTAHRRVFLRLLEAYGKCRPAAADTTVAAYIERVHQKHPDKPRYPPRALESGVLPASPSRYIYTACQGQFLLFDFTRTVTCAKCGGEMPGMNGRRVAKVDTFRFRACCYPAPTYVAIKASAATPYADIIPIFYDLETTPTPETAQHELYLGVVQVPEELVSLGTFNSAAVVITSSREFMEIVGTLIDFYSERATEEQPLLLQLVSFNGSRYDDLFLTEEWKNLVLFRYGAPALRSLGYSERKKAITHNTLRLGCLTVEWTDVLRFVPPTSLRQLAKDFKLDEDKGEMPFEALNDYVRQGPAAVARDTTDGFLALSYFHGDAEKRNKTLAYYKAVVPLAEQTPFQDLRCLCIEYCKQDVRVLAAAYTKIEKMYATYLEPLACIAPGEGKFWPLAMHSLSTMSGRVLLTNALRESCWHYNSHTRKEYSDCPQILAPAGPIYDYLRQSIYGGWTKAYMQGLIIAPTCPPELAAQLRTVATSQVSIPVLAHDMYDVASEYPTAVTTPMPVGAGYWVEDAIKRQELVQQCVDEPDPARIPLFFVRASWKAPIRPLFAESTLPQREQHTNSLRWTYWDDPSCTRVVNSLDLWIACHDHTGGGVDTTWTVLDTKDLLYFPEGAQCYAAFMEGCTKLKMDGAAEGNEQKRTAGKIAMNGSIGKLGQQITAQQNVLGKTNAYNLIQSYGDNVRLLGSREVSYRRGWAAHNETEYIFSIKDTEANRWPAHHASFMYAASRLIRLNWSLATRPTSIRTRGLLDLDHPDTLYGDTDSKILATTHSKLLPAAMIGSQVGKFLVREPPSLLTRPFFQVEAEKVCTPPYIATISGILAPKKYFVWSLAPDGSSRLKFKCNGLTRFNEERHPCPLHGEFHCRLCATCTHTAKWVFECLHCIPTLLLTENIADEAGAICVSGILPGCGHYKYNVWALTSLTLLDFVRVLVTGVSCRTVTSAFDRTLSLATSKLPSYAIRTAAQARSLNRPYILSNRHEIVTDRPSTRTFTAWSSGVCAHPRTAPHLQGFLLPTGTYLVNNNVNQ